MEKYVVTVERAIISLKNVCQNRKDDHSAARKEDKSTLSAMLNQTTQVKRTPMTHTRTESEDTEEAEVSAAVTIGSNAPPTDSKVTNDIESRTAKIW